MSAKTVKGEAVADPLEAVDRLLARRYFQEVLAFLEGEAGRTERAMGYLLTPHDAAKLRALLHE
jgi:hypothetical protein